MNKIKNPQNILQKNKDQKKKGKKTKKLIVVETKVKENEKPVPKFVQKKGESDKAFLNRCNKICQDVIREVDFETKFGVKVNRNPENGMVRKCF